MLLLLLLLLLLLHLLLVELRHVRLGAEQVRDGSPLLILPISRCEYEMHFTSPAACRHHAGHDEL